MRTTTRDAMGSIVTLALVGAGALFYWRTRGTRHCGSCDRRIRSDARICRHCGTDSGVVPTIDVDPI
ncbi:MAG TPA: hypothetical protein V6D47_07395 [Oscillatoriaceae cyanobacterium]